MASSDNSAMPKFRQAVSSFSTACAYMIFSASLVITGVWTLIETLPFWSIVKNLYVSVYDHCKSEYENLNLHEISSQWATGASVKALNRVVDKVDLKATILKKQNRESIEKCINESVENLEIFMYALATICGVFIETNTGLRDKCKSLGTKQVSSILDNTKGPYAIKEVPVFQNVESDKEEKRNVKILNNQQLNIHSVQSEAVAAETVLVGQERNLIQVPKDVTVTTVPCMDPLVNTEVCENTLGRTNLLIKMQLIKSDCKSIEDDIDHIKQEVANAVSGNLSTISFLNELKELCEKLEERIVEDFKGEIEDLAKLEADHYTDWIAEMNYKQKKFSEQIWVIQLEITKARNLLAQSSIGDSVTGSRGNNSDLAAYIEPLKPPVFSGDVDDWIEFRTAWNSLLGELPELVQIQYLKTCLPHSDIKRIVGLRSIKAMWERLNNIHGNPELHVVLIKSRLENLSIEFGEEYEQVIELYQEVEYAVAQLCNLQALKYLEDDVRLINRLVMKLNRNDQKKYADYITSEIVVSDSASRWEKFSKWLEHQYRSSLHMRLIHMCEESSSGTAEFNCKNQTDSMVVDPNTKLSISKGMKMRKSFPTRRGIKGIETLADYKKELVVSRNQVGNCPLCGEIAHLYLRKFPFGKAQWPSVLLSSCPRFHIMSPHDRRLLVDQIGGCFMCTSWEHLTADCRARSKSRCPVVIAGFTCGLDHHKLLHQYKAIDQDNELNEIVHNNGADRNSIAELFHDEEQVGNDEKFSVQAEIHESGDSNVSREFFDGKEDVVEENLSRSSATTDHIRTLSQSVLRNSIPYSHSSVIGGLVKTQCGSSKKLIKEIDNQTTLSISSSSQQVKLAENVLSVCESNNSQLKSLCISLSLHDVKLSKLTEAALDVRNKLDRIISKIYSSGRPNQVLDQSFVSIDSEKFNLKIRPFSKLQQNLCEKRNIEGEVAGCTNITDESCTRSWEKIKGADNLSKPCTVDRKSSVCFLTLKKLVSATSWLKSISTTTASLDEVSMPTLSLEW